MRGRRGEKRKKLYRKSHGIKRLFFYSILSLVFFGLAWAGYKILHLMPTQEWVEVKVAKHEKVVLPRDDAPHQSAVEWWYYNGHLMSESGVPYSFHYTVFLIKSVVNHMVGHVSFNNNKTGERYIAQRRTGGNNSIKTKNRFKFEQDGWVMQGGNGSDELIIRSPEFGFNLKLKATQPPVLQGGNGIISLASAGTSYYYSRSRMHVSGMIENKGSAEKVSGIAWFDHQWGDFSIGQLGWDWFSLQLDGDLDVMIYRLRDETNTPVLYTASITENGKTVYLNASEFNIAPVKYWHSKKTGAVYPIVWEIKIPERNIDIRTEAIINDSEFDARLTTYNVYWEGPVKVFGNHKGIGFMELSGYTSKRSVKN